MDTLILVDSKDRPLGFAQKDNCHNPPKLHRAFSVFIFNAKGDLLITKRSTLKHTWPGFWSNTVCSHPRKGEKTDAAALRRLKEEAGLSADLRELFFFEYSAMYDREWGEHEFDHVFVGRSEIAPHVDKNEIEDWKFISPDQLRNDVKAHPDRYTPWFRMCFERVLKEIGKSK